MAKLANTSDDGFELDDGEDYHRAAPDTFHIPELARRQSLEPGETVKLIFRIALLDADKNETVEVERMWVEVKGKTGSLYRGLLDNDPYSTEGIQAGMEVFFEARHVIQIYED